MGDATSYLKVRSSLANQPPAQALNQPPLQGDLVNILAMTNNNNSYSFRTFFDMINNPEVATANASQATQAPAQGLPIFFGIALKPLDCFLKSLAYGMV